MDVVNPEIEERYDAAITAWQVAIGATVLDMTPAQLRRFRALERAEGSPENAPRLLFARFLYRTGRIRL